MKEIHISSLSFSISIEPVEIFWNDDDRYPHSIDIVRRLDIILYTKNIDLWKPACCNSELVKLVVHNVTPKKQNLGRVIVVNKRAYRTGLKMEMTALVNSCNLDGDRYRITLTSTGMVVCE